MTSAAIGDGADFLACWKEEQLLQAASAKSFLETIATNAPEIVVILGTGLGSGMSGGLGDAVTVPYASIPHFPQATVPGHAGSLVLGSCQGRCVALLQGRFHFYEGYSARQLTFPLRVLSLMGARSLIVCNVSGGLNPHFSAGSLMLIRDHLSFIPDNPLRGPNIDAWGPRFPDLSCAYDLELKELAKRTAKSLGVDGICEGVYSAVPGPSLETPAETRYLRNCGADAVGMSTVPEVILARHAGMRVLGISVIANVNDPDNMQPILLEEVMAAAAKASANLEKLILALLWEWPE